MSRCTLLTLIFLSASTTALCETFQVDVHLHRAGVPLGGVKIEFHREHDQPPFETEVTDAAGRAEASIERGRLLVRAVAAPALDLAPAVSDVNLDRDVRVQFDMAQEVRISGRFQSEDGSPLPGRVEVHPLDVGFPSTSEGPLFSFDVRASRYSILGIPANANAPIGRLYVDARSGDVSGLIVKSGIGSVVPQHPPVARLITIGSADSDGMGLVQGAAGAVEANATVLVANLNTLQTTLTVSEPDGSFTARTFVLPGTSIHVKHDPSGRYLQFGGRAGTDFVEGPPGTTISTPLMGSPIAFTAACSIDSQGARSTRPYLGVIPSLGTTDAGQWWITGELPQRTFRAGDRVTLGGHLTMKSLDLTPEALASIQVTGEIHLQRLFDSEGRQRETIHQYGSALLTPTGFPIEQLAGAGIDTDSIWSSTALQMTGEDRLEADWSATVHIHPDLRGIYRPVVDLFVAGMPAHQWHFDAQPALTQGNYRIRAALPLVRIGEIPKRHLTWVLLQDAISNGDRGVVAVEDRDHYQTSNHVKTSPLRFVLPPRHPRTGAPIVYNLEPFSPMISIGTGRLPDVPLIPFKFPSGSLTITVTEPDGTQRTLGPVPFAQSVSRSPLSPSGLAISGHGSFTAHLSDIFQLTTMTSLFDYTFTRYGRHEIVVNGSIDDVWGDTYTGGGMYEVWIAEPLNLETAVIPGTPLDVADHVAPFVSIQPPVPAEVTMRVTRMPKSDPAKAVLTELRGRANRFGTHAPPEEIVMHEEGEYRIDVTASHVDADGRLWLGDLSWGSVIASPESSVIVHGRRGFDSGEASQSQWFVFRGSPHDGGHVMYPFHSGDVMWMNDIGAADMPKISLQDSEGSLLARIRERAGSAAVEQPSFGERAAEGEIPLVTTTPEGLEASSIHESIDRWGYFYAFAERPGVHVREFVSQDFSGNGYWRFSETYQNQLGVGINGDLPNDFKFQFGGAVYRDPSANLFFYGGYSSMFVLLPDDDPTGGRIMPPFQGNGGGPDGGPLFKLKGKEIDLFFHPTAVRPGTILHRGSNASFAGYSAPTLPSKVEIVVTSPSGQTRTIAGQANKIGYFFDPSQDFTVGESGVWKARVRIVFDGRTAAGQVTEPFPSGDVLGSRNGEFYFYVVDANSPPVILSRVDGEGSQNATASHSEILRSACNEFVIPNREDGEGASDSGEDRTYAGDSSPSSRLGMTVVHLRSTGAARPSPAQDGVQFLRPADGPITFTIEKPAGLTNAQLAYTTTMPGFILEEGIKTSMTYVYDAQKLAEDFPNLDLHDQDGYAGVDTITISFLLSGTEAGKTKHYARQIVIQGEELQMPDQEARPKRRVVR